MADPSDVVRSPDRLRDRSGSSSIRATWSRARRVGPAARAAGTSAARAVRRTVSGVYCFIDLGLPAAAYTVQVQPLAANHDQFFATERAVRSSRRSGRPGSRCWRNPVRVDLLPRPAYPFPDQATLARGRLVKASDGSAVEGAQVS